MTLACLLLGHRWTLSRVNRITRRYRRTCVRCGTVEVGGIPENRNVQA